MHSTWPVFSPFRNDRKALDAALEYAELLREEGVGNMELTRRFVGLWYHSSDEATVSEKRQVSAPALTIW